MKRWKGASAVVTGASFGIGKQVCRDLLCYGLKVAGIALEMEPMKKFRRTLICEQRKNFLPIKCDLTDEIQLRDTFCRINDKHCGVDILVNCAGLLKTGNLFEMDIKTVNETINTNVIALVMCCKEAFESMRERDAVGHIILINSVMGHTIPFIPKYSFNIQAACKFAITGVAQVYHHENINLKTKVKVTSLSPGAVTRSDQKSNLEILHPSDISNAVIFALNTPPNVCVRELTITGIGTKY